MGRILVWLVMFRAVAAACSCGGGGACPGLGSVDGPRFVGTVLAVVDIAPNEEVRFLESRKARLRVEEAFGGIGEGRKEVEVWTGRGGGDCGVEFRVGERYLVDAVAGKDGRLHASICSFTRHVQAAGAMLQVLRRLRDGARAPLLTGRIVQSERNFVDDYGTRPARALGGTVVRVRSGESSFQTVADGDGVYAFYDLPQGKYEFAAELPEGVALVEWTGSERPLRAVEVAGAGCQLANLSATSRGSIAGKLVDAAGRPVAGVGVAVAPVEKELLPGMRHYSERTDGAGEFRLIHIPPGEYVLVVDPANQGADVFPYGKTFYPGVPERAGAGVVRVAAGEQVAVADIRLKREYEPRQVRVRATWANGERVRLFVYVDARGTGRAGVKSIAGVGKEEETAELTLLPGEPYEVEGRVICPGGAGNFRGTELRSAKVGVAPGDGKTEVALVIPGTGCPVVVGK